MYKESPEDYQRLQPPVPQSALSAALRKTSPHVTRNSAETLLPSPTLKPSVTVAPVYSPDVEELLIESHSLGVRLNNSAILSSLSTCLSYLPEDQRNDVEMLLWKHPTLFADVPGKTSMLFHDIDVGNSIPIKQHPCRVNPAKRVIMRSEVHYLLTNGLAVPSQHPWSSPCLLVPKSDNTFRFCTDYRKVNSVTKPDSFPLPRMEDCMDRIGASKFVCF